MSNNPGPAKSRWISVLTEALEFDAWGQIEEAIDEYKMVDRLIGSSVDELKCSTNDAAIAVKIANVCLLRCDTLQPPEDMNDNHQDVTLEQVKSVVPILQALFSGRKRGPKTEDFPIVIASSSIRQLQPRESESVFENDMLISPKASSRFQVDKKNRGGTLLPPPKFLAPGDVTMSVDIIMIELINPQQYDKPIMTISVVADDGTCVSTQDTPPSTKVTSSGITFNNVAHIQESVSDFNQHNYSIFFEFRHWKSKKKINSVKCFSFLELRDITKRANKQTSLELYKKPTDFLKRKVTLFSKKDKLSVRVNLTKH